MCDCYIHKCIAPDCDAMVEMHLANFDTGRDEIDVYCEKHGPTLPLTYGKWWRYRDSKREKWRLVFIEPKTENARRHESGNHPNYADADMLDPITGRVVCHE